MTVRRDRLTTLGPDPLALATDEDRRTAEATIPRGTSAEDTGRAPAVDERLWLLHVVHARTGDPAALQALVEEYEAYACTLAQRLHRHREPLEDLRQVAIEALIKALQRFRPAYGTPFVAFASPTIVGALKRHYRDHGWAMRVPRGAHEVVAPARVAAEELTGRLGRTATDTEVARAIGIDEEVLRAASAARRARTLVSIDAPVGPDDERHLELCQADAGLALVEGRVALQQALTHLGERDRTVLGLYFFEEMTQSQIGRRFGVSQMQVSRWIASALARLRGHMAADVEPAA